MWMGAVEKDVPQATLRGHVKQLVVLDEAGNGGISTPNKF